MTFLKSQRINSRYLLKDFIKVRDAFKATLETSKWEQIKYEAAKLSELGKKILGLDKY